MAEPGPRTILITGSTAGLGLAATRRLLADGHRVILHGRDRARADEVADALAAEHGRRPDVVVADLGSLDAVRSMAAEVMVRFAIDVLVNNAAISNWGRAAREATVDGHERIFATNYLGPYLLTRRLLPHLLRVPGARVVNVGARQMGASIDLDDLGMTRAYDPMRAVLRAKVGLFCVTRALAARHAATGLRVACLDPGLVRTGYQARAGVVMRLALAVLGRPPERVAELYRWLIHSDDVDPDGRLYARPGAPARWHRWVADDANVARVWDETARLVGEPA